MKNKFVKMTAAVLAGHDASDRLWTERRFY